MTTSPPRYISGSAGETFGRVLHARRAGRFLFRESRYVPALHMPPHYHPRPYFTFVADGQVRERVAGTEQDYGAGSVHFHAAGDPHTAWLGQGGATCLSIVLAGDFPESVTKPPTVRQGCAAWPAAAQLAGRCHRELRATDTASDLALEALALEMLATLLRRGTSRERGAPGWLLVVRDYLRAHRLEPVRLAELSAIAGIHEVHLVRAFRRHFGVTPGAYLRGLRIDQARQALTESDAPIADLALAAGFSSQSHFTRVFRRLTGATPAAYRRDRSRRP
jgi:AraC family transcriptional regulator